MCSGASRGPAPTTVPSVVGATIFLQRRPDMNPAILIPVLILAGVGLFLWRATRRPAEAPRQADPAPRASYTAPPARRERPSLSPPISRRADPAPTRRDDPVAASPLTDPFSPLNPASPIYAGSSSYDSGGSCGSSSYDSGSSSSSFSDGGSSSGGGCD